MTGKTALVTTSPTYPAIRSRAALDMARAAKSKNTLTSYSAGWHIFADNFCHDLDYIPLPATPEAIIEFITWSSDRHTVSTIEARLAAISFVHRMNNQPDPTTDNQVKLVLTGLRRLKGTKPYRVAPLMDDGLLSVLNALPDSLRGVRDRALLLVGYACALRRSEIAALQVRDVVFRESKVVRDHELNPDTMRFRANDVTVGGSEMTVTLPRRKTDQYGHGTTIVVPKVGGALCAYTALRHWLRESKIKSGAIFRGINRWDEITGKGALDPGSIARILREDVKRAGLDWRTFSGHSLRAGFITSASDHDVPEARIREVSGHRSNALYAYIRDSGRGGRRAISTVLSRGEK